MYQPAPHRQDDPGAQRSLIRANPLGILVHQSAAGLVADHIPFLLDEDATGRVVLQAHVARANPLWRALDGGEVLVIFQDANAYVSPSWYPSKPETGKVVPTWNYAIVHAWGPARAIDDADWIRNQVEALTSRHEHGREAPWRVDDAPADYLKQMLSAIVGIEIPVARMQGKWKVSQNRSASDRAGVADGLRAEGSDAALRMAALVDAAGKR